jgi:hypothetical protein
LGADLPLLGTGIVLLAFGTVATDVETTVDSRSAREIDSRSARAVGSISAALSGTQTQRHEPPASAGGGSFAEGSFADGGGPVGGIGRLDNPGGGSLANSSAEAKSIAEAVPLSKRASCEALHGFPPLAPLGFFAFPPCEDIHKDCIQLSSLGMQSRKREEERMQIAQERITKA